MDFFEAQDEARKKTRGLLVLFLFCVLGVVLSLALLAWGVGLLGGVELAVPTLAMVGFGAGVLIFVASGFKAMELRGGGGVVARDLGGRLISPTTTETDERRLLNIVEEMAIASGLPVPQVYLLDHEAGINAFAAGTESGNAAIGVTRGCMMRLSRAELQGVIAHEFAHILNGDMKLNMRLIGWIFGLVVLSILGKGLLQSLRFVHIGGGNRRENNGGGAILLAIVAIGLGLLVIGAVGVFFARLLQAAVSRQREFLADASAVQFTREPDGLAGALKKIGGRGSKMESPKASEASHCFFADGGLFAFGFATHPPLALRIGRISKDWDGEFSAGELPPIAGERTPLATGNSPRALASPPPLVSNFAADESLSSPERISQDRGHLIREAIPAHWRQAVHHREEAQALVFGLLLAQDSRLRAEEMTLLENSAGHAAAELALRWQGELGQLHSARKIALIDLAIPTLRTLSRAEYERFVGITSELIGSDGRVDVFEFMLQRLIAHHLESHFGWKASRKIRYRQVEELARETALLISSFAHLNPDANAAFEQATVGLALSGAQLFDPNQISLTEINAALESLEQATPLVKKEALQACAKAVASDGELSSREAELLRAMADSIGCAIPPWVVDELTQTQP